MSSLRRDLFERRLWPLVLLLIAAIAAVPFLLRGHGGGNATAEAIPVPPRAVAIEAGAVRHIPTKVRRRLMRDKVMRDPFTAAASHLTHKPTYVSQSSAQAGAGMVSPAANGSGASSGSGGLPIPVSPSSSDSSSDSAPSSPASVVSGSSGAAAPTTTVTTTQTTTTHGAASPIGDGPWTIYSVGLQVSGSGHRHDLRNVARLTPLPSPAAPKAMFVGVMSGGTEAAFALAAGVTASGPGVCRPDHDRCSVISLKPGQTETLAVGDTDGETHRLSFPAATQATETLTLRVTGIASDTTASATTALAAFKRQSDAGACELELGDPVEYDADRGALKSVMTHGCRRSENRVPFPGTVTGS